MEDNFELKNGSIWLLEDIKTALQQVYDHYRSVKNSNEYLRKENERLKSEAYKDEELSKMEEKYNKMKSAYYRGFPISEEEDKKIQEWIKLQIEKYPNDAGAIGGRFRYEFIATSIGVIGTIVDSFTNDTFNFQSL